MQNKELKKSYMPVYFNLIKNTNFTVKFSLKVDDFVHKSPCWCAPAREFANCMGLYGRFADLQQTFSPLRLHFGLNKKILACSSF